MLNNNYLKKILEALVAQGSADGKGATSSITLKNKTPYLVLFKTMPNLEGQGGEEISLRGYERLPLNNPSIQGTHFFTEVPQEDVNTKEISITNTSPIQMHSIDEDVKEEEGEEVLGFGIVDYNDNNKPLIAWGRLQDDHGNLVKGTVDVLARINGTDEEFDSAEVTAPKLIGGSVPIFDPGTLTLAFSNSEGGLDVNLQKDLLKMIVNYWHEDNDNPDNSDFVNEITFNSYYPKVALFTDLDNRIEPSINGEIIKGYTRKNLYGYTPTVAEGDINGLQFKDSAFIEGTTGTVYASGEAYATIQNTNEIQMSAITEAGIDENNAIRVYGFGIYAQSELNNSNSDRLVAWGPLVVDIEGRGTVAVDNNTAPKLQTGSVPIFYKDKFKMQLGGDNTETYIALDKMELDLYKLLRGSGENEVEAPEGWSNDYLNYYTKEKIIFSPNKSAEWAPGKYYEKVNQPIYESIVNMPADFGTAPYLYYKLDDGKYVPVTASDKWNTDDPDYHGPYYNKTSNNDKINNPIIALDPDDLYYLGVEFKPNTYTGQPTFISSNPATFSVDNSTGAINYQQVNNGQKGTFTAILNQKETEIGTLEYEYRNPKITDVQFTIQGKNNIQVTVDNNKIYFPGAGNAEISISFKNAEDFIETVQNSLKFSENSPPTATKTISNSLISLTANKSSDKKITITVTDTNQQTTKPSGLIGYITIYYTGSRLEPSSKIYNIYYNTTPQQ